MSYFVVLFIFLFISSCATIIHGKDQKVTVQTEPIGAQVYVNGKEAGETPVVLTLPRKQDHVLNVALNGYHLETAQLKRSLAGTAVFYLLPGGLLSLMIDSSNGSHYKLPESVHLALKPLFDPKTVIASQLNSFKAMNRKLFTRPLT